MFAMFASQEKLSVDFFYNFRRMIMNGKHSLLSSAQRTFPGCGFMPVHVKKTLETDDCEEKEKRVGDGTHTKRGGKNIYSLSID